MKLYYSDTMMTPTHPTLIFTTLALILGLGAWTLNPIDPAPLSFSDEFSFLGIVHGKNVLSSLLLSAVGVWGLMGRPRFDHGRDVLISMVICCLSMILAGGSSVWFHLVETQLAQSVTHGLISLVLLNASFALIASQLVLRGRWWLLGSLQLLSVGTVAYQHVYHDQRFLLMSEVFVILLMIFTLLRVWKLSASIYLLFCTMSLGLGWLCGAFDIKINVATAYMISGHTLQHICWILGAACWLRYFILLRPRDLAQLLNKSPMT